MMKSGHLPELRVKPARSENIRPIIEKYMQFLAVFAVALTVIYSAAHGFSPKGTEYAGTIRVTVQKGDSLWKYARNYGDPDEYILKRVHKIARINGLEVNHPLQPGQELIVPCERKTVCASTDKQMP